VKNNPILSSTNQIKQNIRRLVLVGSVLIYWYFGFNPFQLQKPFEIKTNAVSYSTTDGIQSNGFGIGYTHNPPEWLESAISKTKLDIKLEFQAAKIKQFGPARILTLSKGQNTRNLTIGQDGTDIVLRIRSPLSSLNGYPPYRFKNALKSKDWNQLHISITPGKLSIIFNNVEQKYSFIPRHFISQWSPDYQLAVGNEFIDNRPWLGKIRHIVIKSEDKKIDYLKKGSLYFPKNIVLVNAAINLIPFSEGILNVRSILDWFVNLLGFIPFGFLLIINLNKRLTVLKAMALCALLSLSIETGQLFLTERVTEIEDLILNSAGGLLGVLIGIQYRGYK
jgi:hypothetical protein